MLISLIPGAAGRLFRQQGCETMHVTVGGVLMFEQNQSYQFTHRIQPRDDWLALGCCAFFEQQWNTHFY
ncbi:hypothetical protein LK542_05225 [Massilia sp. IC2-477]|uniref:hypothetical protein n=1 Tax=unclassified Massilia TaxID=2609279 RepID=UPI001D0FD14B|nr:MULTISPECIES: hypothetical protein [unclassified Massilia]MCC2955018.1 hypothetical protein [Massilia sp. IC2-477]MCC2973012.1 hypothetical protein [Massilia sp. IC2-476]